MDYEKAYNEALERAKNMIDDLRKGEDILAVSELEAMFPELRESEDEIHRKWILEYLYDGLRKADEQFKDHFKSAINWLEKQKEQKPDTRDSDDLQLIGFVYDLLNEIEWNDNWAMSKDACLRRLNNYRPQKPAEWSEEDEEMLNSCISSIEESKENRYAYKETDGDTSYDREVDWLESLRNRVGKESLQSWKPSEEQMEALLWCIAHLGGADHRTLAELYEHLKQL